MGGVGSQSKPLKPRPGPATALPKVCQCPTSTPVVRALTQAGPSALLLSQRVPSSHVPLALLTVCCNVSFYSLVNCLSPPLTSVMSTRVGFLLVFAVSAWHGKHLTGAY